MRLACTAAKRVPYIRVSHLFPLYDSPGHTGAQTNLQSTTDALEYRAAKVARLADDASEIYWRLYARTWLFTATPEQGTLFAVDSMSSDALSIVSSSMTGQVELLSQ